MNRKDLWLPLHPFHQCCLPHSSTAPPISLHFSFPTYRTGTTPGHHPSRFPPVPGIPLPLISGNIPALQATKENPAEGSPGRGRSGAIRIHTTKPPASRVKLTVRWNLNTQLKRLLSTYNCDTALGLSQLALIIQICLLETISSPGFRPSFTCVNTPATTECKWPYKAWPVISLISLFVLLPGSNTLSGARYPAEQV